MKHILTTVVFSVLAAYGISYGQTSGQGPLIGGRPGFSESSMTVPVGAVQIEAGYRFARTAKDREHTVGDVLLRFGVRSRVEIGIGVNSYMVASRTGGNDNGFGDGSVNVRVNFSEGSQQFSLFRPSAALLVATTLPVGSDVFSEEKFQPETKLALEWEISSAISLGSTISYSVVRESVQSYDQFAGSIALGFALNDMSGYYFEYYRIMPENKGGPDRNFLESGFTHLVNNDIQLDIHGGSLVNGGETDYYISAGFCYRFFVTW